MLQLINLA